MSTVIAVEVVYGLRDTQRVVALTLPQGSLVSDALEAARQDLLKCFPDLLIESAAIGVYGRKVSPDHRLKAGDRVEIYRPLIADPKAVRRAKAEADKAAEQAG